MKKILLLLIASSFMISFAQESKSITINPKRTAEVKTKMEQAYPPKAKQPATPAANTSSEKKGGTETKKTTAAKPFSFLGTFTMNFDDKNKQGHYNTGKIKYALDGTNAAIVPSFANMKELSSLRSVVDMTEKEITMLTVDLKGKKNGLLMKMPKPVLTKVTDEKKVVKPVIKKTGETRVIQGFKCEKIVVTLADTTKIESWVTNDILINMGELLNMTNAGFKGKSPFSKTNMDDIKGTAMETTITRTDGGIMKLTLSDIKKGKPDAALYSTDGFKVTDVRSMPMFSGQ